MVPETPSRVIDYAEASRIVRLQAEIAGRELVSSPQTLPLLECLGRILAEPIRADRDQPPFDRSTRDGFACRAADLNTGRPLKVLGQIRAGGEWQPEGVKIAAGESVEIMTGAPVPPGADCVLMVEHVQRHGDTAIVAEPRALSPGANIVPRAAEARANDVILSAGIRMLPPQIAAAASCGAAEVKVFPRPRVAIIATGDELVDLDRQPLPYQIRNSNSYSLAAEVLAIGAESLQVAIARDDRNHLQQLIRNLPDADLLLLSGGVSAGRYDLVEEVLLSLGAEFFFTGVLIQPGKPVVFGRLPHARRSMYFFGLPGNPVSTIVTFTLFVTPMLDALCGQASTRPRFAQARLASAFQGKTGLTRFLPAVLSANSEDPIIQPCVTPVAWQGSGDLAATSRTNCFLVVPANRSSLDAGETVTVLLA